MYFVVLGEVVHLYDLLIALGGILCLIGAALPIPGVPGKTRLGFLVFGVILVALFFIAYRATSFTYPIIVLAAPLIAVIQLIKTIFEAVKNNKIARDPMLAYNLNQGQPAGYGQDSAGYGVAPSSAPNTYGDADTYGTPALDHSNPGGGYGVAPQQAAYGAQSHYGAQPNYGAQSNYGATSSFEAPSPYSAPAATSANSVTGGNYTVAHAADPGATPQTLSEIAATSPHLHAQLANNPATFPELLDWLAANGTPEVQQAVAYRRSQAF